MSPNDTTIVGVATGTPDGGVAIVRLSGPQARSITETIVGPLAAPRVLARRQLRDGSGVGDDALVVWMPGPRSLTGEDVVELHVHAGRLNVQRVIASLIERGAIAAGPGEFTRRAFEHGRLSLEQAEGIAALIAAQTDAGVEQARRLIAGELGREVESLRAAVGELRGEVEANLDFPEDIAAGDVRRWCEEIAGFEATLGGWTRRFAAGQRMRERPRVVIAGPPNAGKSALFNALLQQSRAIVSPVPGTTRDYVEAELWIGGREVRLVDTAGLRDGSDAIEVEGIARSREQIEGAEVVLWVEAADSIEETVVLEGPRVIVVENKIDLGRRRAAWIGVSARSGDGMSALRAVIEETLRGPVEEPWIGLARHRDRAEAAVKALGDARAELEHEGLLEIAAFLLGSAEREFGEITGRSALGPVGDEVLTRIFARFCIGK